MRSIGMTVTRWMPSWMKRAFPTQLRRRVRRWISTNTPPSRDDQLVLAKRQATAATEARDWETAAELWSYVVTRSERPSGKAFARLAQAARKSGNTEAAEAAVARGLKSFPNHRRLRIEEAEVAMSRQDWQAASQLWAAFASSGDPVSPRLYARMARAHRRAGDLGAAADAIVRGREQGADDTRFDVEAAEVAAAERDWNEAVARWRAVVASGEAGVHSYLKLAEAYSELGHFFEAKVASSQGLRLYPGDPSLELELVAIAVRESGWNEAQRLWYEILARATSPVPVSRRVKLAKHCLAALEYRGADLVIEEGLRQEPGDLRLQLQYIRNVVAEERRTEDPGLWKMSGALDRCIQLLDACPDRASEHLFLDLANELSDATALGEACALLRSGLVAHPGNPQLLDELATLAMATGEWEEAATCFDQLFSSVPPTEQRQLLVRASRAHRAAGDYELAMSGIVDRVGKKDGVGLALSVESLQIARERGDHAAAAMKAEYIIEEWPEVPVSVYRQCVCAHLAAGETSTANELTLAAARRYPGHLEGNPGVVAIIGGGTSLQGVDLTPLRGVAHCVGVNATSRALPWVDVTVTHDTSHLAERVRESPAPVVAGVSRDHLKNQGPLRGVEYRRRLVTQRLSELDEVVHSGGHTSAYTALNYAFLLRPRRIVLFGIDLVAFWGPDDSWHKQMDPYNRRRYEMLERRPTFDEFREYRNRKLRHADSVFSSALPQLERCGIEVFNASPVSSIKCFPKVSPEEGIQRCISA